MVGVALTEGVVICQGFSSDLQVAKVFLASKLVLIPPQPEMPDDAGLSDSCKDILPSWATGMDKTEGASCPSCYCCKWSVHDIHGSDAEHYSHEAGT